MFVALREYKTYIFTSSYEQKLKPIDRVKKEKTLKIL